MLDTKGWKESPQHALLRGQRGSGRGRRRQRPEAGAEGLRLWPGCWKGAGGEGVTGRVGGDLKGKRAG